MKTHTSKHIIWVRSLILLPLLALLIYSFSTNKIVEKHIGSKSLESSHTARSIDIDVLENGTYKIDGSSATKATFVSVLNHMHQDITPEIRNRIINVHVNNSKPVSDEEVWFIYNTFIKYGFHRIVTYNQEIIREKGNTPFAIEKKIDQQKGATKAQIAEYNKLAKYYNSQKGDSYTIKLSDMKRIKYLYDLMTEEQRKSAEPFPNFPPPPPPAPIPETISKKEKAEYDAMAKKAKAGKAYTYKYTDEYGKAVKVEVSERDTKILPPPPPPVPANATQEQKKKYKKAHEEYYKKYKVENGKISEREPLPPAPPKPEIVEVPPPPPPPKSPLDHVIDMAKKGATFYYEGKQISSDKAIEILKTNKSMNISSKNSDSKNPKVYLSKEPIKIKNK